MNLRQKQQSYRYGLEAETYAIEYYMKHGFTLIAQRYRNAYGEIDVIVRKERLLCFVEVKARKSIEDGLYALTPRQQQRMIQCAQGFLAEHPAYQPDDMRFDLIAIADWKLHHETNIICAE